MSPKPPSFAEQLTVVESARLAKLSIEKVYRYALPALLALAAPGGAQPGLRHFRRTSNIDSLVIHPLSTHAAAQFRGRAP